MKELDPTVAAYVDGELDPQDCARFEAEMSHDLALADHVALQRRLRERLAAAYDPVLGEHIPMRLTLGLKAANDRAGRRFGLHHWGALAASLMIGVFVGRTALPERGPLAIRGELAQALNKQLASDRGLIRIGLSFRANDGRYCRTFQSASDSLAGVACRDNGRWRARTVTAWTSAAPDYRTASTDLPPEVLAAVDALIEDEALDAAAEREARDHGWRPDIPGVGRTAPRD